MGGDASDPRTPRRRPVIVAYRGDDLVLEDGNHRVEGLRRAGNTEVWAVVGFERAEDRDRFLAEWG